MKQSRLVLCLHFSQHLLTIAYFEFGQESGKVERRARQVVAAQLGQRRCWHLARNLNNVATYAWLENRH